MLHVNDEMDNLFRRAADDYPLNIEGRDWNKVSEVLSNNTKSNAENGLKNKRRHFLWLLLLLPLGWVCNKYLAKEDDGRITTSVVNGYINNNIPASAPVAANKKSGNNVARLHEVWANKKQAKMFTSSRRQSSLRSTPISKQSSVVVPFQNSLLNKDITGKMEVARLNENRIKEANTRGGTEDKPFNFNQQKDQQPAFDKLPVGLPSSQQDTVATAKPAIPAKQKEKSLKNSEFYLGMIGGPDITAVKNQGVKNTGYSYGLLAGYRFSKRLSVEAMLLSDKKYYYSSGEYFSTKRTYIPANYKVNDITGNCRMLDLAVNVRYDVVKFEKGGFFASAGLSSYYMKKEEYDYTYKYNTNLVTRHSIYTNSSNNVTSMLNLSLGYSYRLPFNMQVRLEPYFKVPLRGVGIGNMPLSSKGFYIGITRKIF